MRKWIKKMKWLAGISTALALFATVPVVHGWGLGWTGIDPVLKANGHTMNVWVEWPTGRECDINGPISLEVRGQAVLLAESLQAFTCGLSLKTVQTQTTVKDDGLPYHFHVRNVLVRSPETFPVQAKVYEDGGLEEICRGQTNQPFNCEKVELD